MDKYKATVLLGVCELIGAILCVMLVRITGKRPLVFLSLIVSAICFSSTGFYAHYYGVSPEPKNNTTPNDVALLAASKSNNNPLLFINETHSKSSLDFMNFQAPDAPTDHRPTWVPLALLLTCALFTHIGIGIIPWALIGEMYPANVRSGASGLSSGSGYLFAFFSNKLFLWMIETLTLPGTFWFYSSVSIVGCIVFYLVLPETEGKTLLEIEAHFVRRRAK